MQTVGRREVKPLRCHRQWLERQRQVQRVFRHRVRLVQFDDGGSSHLIFLATSFQGCSPTEAHLPTFTVVDMQAYIGAVCIESYTVHVDDGGVGIAHNYVVPNFRLGLHRQSGDSKENGDDC